MKNIYIRAFRATDDSDACLKFADGHRRVLHNVGITEVTSSRNAWMHNPSVYVVLVESEDRSKTYGGIRVHIADQKTPLPVEDATKEIDPKIVDIIKNSSAEGTGEICGLWNSLEVAGYGIGSKYAIRSAICILPFINLKSCYALCSPYTARIVKGNYGFVVERSLGNDGTFYYPKLDLLATVTCLPDSSDLEKSNPEEQKMMLSLRDNPIQKVNEVGPKGKVQVTYDLSL